MGEVMEAVGGDGFLITTPAQGVTRIEIAEVTDGLVPALQRRGQELKVLNPFSL